MLDQLYTLTVTNNKRQLVYNKQNKLIDTKPYNIHFDEMSDLSALRADSDD